MWLCDIISLKVLLEAGGDIDAVDDDGNSPLHVTCYGEDGNPSELALIEIQVSHVQEIWKVMIVLTRIARTRDNLKTYAKMSTERA